MAVNKVAQLRGNLATGRATRPRSEPGQRPLSDLARRRGTLAAVSAALFGIQLDFFALNLGASVVVMVIRQLLVRRGLMKPLSMAADIPAARVARPGR